MLFSGLLKKFKNAYDDILYDKAFRGLYDISREGQLIVRYERTGVVIWMEVDLNEYKVRTDRQMVIDLYDDVISGGCIIITNK